MSSAMQLKNFALRISTEGACVEPSAWLWHYMASSVLTSRQQLNVVFTDITDETRVRRKGRIKFIKNTDKCTCIYECNFSTQ
jgi:hypothetical protein